MPQYNEHIGGVFFTPAERVRARENLGYDPFGYYNQHTGQVEYSPAQQVALEARQAETAEAARIQRHDRDEDPERFDQAALFELEQDQIQIAFSVDHARVEALNAFVHSIEPGSDGLTDEDFLDDNKEAVYNLMMVLYYHAIQAGERLLEGDKHE